MDWHIIRRAISMAAIIGAPIIPVVSCNEIEPHHNTTYVWGEDDWSQIWPADKVAASADSALVDYVILHNNGVSFQGKTTTTLLKQLNTIIESITPSNRYKIQGSGILNDIGLTNDQQWEDSTKLARMGFKFGTVHHNGYKHR